MIPVWIGVETTLANCCTTEIEDGVVTRFVNEEEEEDAEEDLIAARKGGDPDEVEEEEEEEICFHDSVSEGRN